MSKFFTALPLCAALAMMAPLPLLAQTATATEEVKPQTTESPKVEEQLSLGEDASGDPELGKPYTQEVIGAWEMRCIKTEAEVDP